MLSTITSKTPANFTASTESKGFLPAAICWIGWRRRELGPKGARRSIPEVMKSHPVPHACDEREL